MILNAGRKCSADRRILAPLAFLAAALASCSDGTGPIQSATRSSGELRTAADSAAFRSALRPSANLGALASGEVTADSGDVVTIIVTRTNCAAENVLTVSGVIEGTVSGDACDSEGSIVTFGPTVAAGNINFRLYSNYGTGRYRVEGAHPSYTVRFDDAFGDGDFDDIVLWVRCTSDCDLLDRPSRDTILDNPIVQSGLKDIWAWSDPENPTMFARQEVGMWIVRNLQDGTFTWVPFDNASALACALELPLDQMTRINDSGTQRVVGVAHTHPHEPGEYPNPGTCSTRRHPRIRIQDGASGADINAAQALGLPSYALDREHVHRARPNGRVDTFNRNPNCK